MNTWHRPAGSATASGFTVAVTPDGVGWEHAGLHVADLGAGESRTVRTGDSEWLVLPLSGRWRVECDNELVLLSGRDDPFAGPTDYAYVPCGSTMTITTTTGGRVALPHATTEEPLPFRRVGVEWVTTGLIGTGHTSRQQRRVGTPDVLEARSLIVLEELTPGGNWSAWPPHRHDRQRHDQESAVEEICYVELRRQHGAPDGDGGFAFHHVHGTPDRPINVAATVRTGDVVLVPYGWHGPAMTPPGYDMYSLHVIAGAGPRHQVLMTEQPEHAWVTSALASQPGDPRLPFPETR